MIVRNEADRHLHRALSHAASYVDAITIIDDASEDGTVDVCRDAVGDVPLKLVSNERSRFANEVELRMQQWELATSVEPDWILVLDADEVFEDRIREKIGELVAQDEHDLVAFRLYDFWDEHHYRDDRLWTAHRRYWPLLVRYRRGFPYRWLDAPLHGPRLPVSALAVPALRSEVRVKHYGWARVKDRKAKYERYMRLDPGGRHGVCAQYESILDLEPTLRRWVE